jgi:hypothetical protein
LRISEERRKDIQRKKRILTSIKYDPVSEPYILAIRTTIVRRKNIPGTNGSNRRTKDEGCEDEKRRRQEGRKMTHLRRKVRQGLR